jgi:heme exporter protein D
MSTFNSVAWFPLCAGLTALGLVGSWVALRRRGAGSALRWAAWALLPIAAYLTGAVEMLWRIGVAIADWVGGFAFSPRVWSGVIVALVALLLFVVSGALRRRTPSGADRPAVQSARQPGKATQGAIDQPPARQTAVQRKGGKNDDDEFAEIEEILRRRGIS